MRKVLVFFSTVLIAIVCLADESAAQVLKTQTFTNSQGEVVETPYVTRSELRDVRLHRLDGTVRLEEIMRVVSISEVTELLGEPDSTKIQDIGSGSYERVIRLVYGGMKLRYMDYTDAVGKTRLINLKISSHSQYIEIGGKKIQPGMPSNRLSKSVRKSQVGDESSPARSYLIRISEGKAKTSKGGERTSEFADHEALSIKVDQKTDQVVQIRYYTMV